MGHEAGVFRLTAPSQSIGPHYWTVRTSLWCWENWEEGKIPSHITVRLSGRHIRSWQLPPGTPRSAHPLLSKWKKNGRGTIFVKDKIPRELSHCGPGLTSERYLVLRDLAGFHPEGAARVATFHPSCCNGPYIRNKQRWSQGASESCLDWTISLGHCMFPTVQSCGIPWVECLLWLWSLFGYPYGFSTSPVDLERCSGYTGLVKIRPGCLIYRKEQNQGYLCGVWMWLLVLKVFFFFLFSQQNSTRQCYPHKSSSVPSFHSCVATMQFFLLHIKTIACKCPCSIKHMEKYSALCFLLNEYIWHVNINLD